MESKLKIVLKECTKMNMLIIENLENTEKQK